MRAAAVLCAGLALAACQGVPGAAVGQRDATATKAAQPVTLPPPKPSCPPFRPWSEADLKTLSGTLEAWPQNSPIIRMALDWRRYYGDAKACERAQGKP